MWLCTRIEEACKLGVCFSVRDSVVHCVLRFCSLTNVRRHCATAPSPHKELEARITANIQKIGGNVRATEEQVKCGKQWSCHDFCAGGEATTREAWSVVLPLPPIVVVIAVIAWGNLPSVRRQRMLHSCMFSVFSSFLHNHSLLCATG
eukprot:GHVU01140769.1.p1 GENE.GHVU01140769.1~~GHVU01140769.1.p1  ORF type:complete len:148 (+),score=8.04 GHVU01140769.1:306-749(+)